MLCYVTDVTCMMSPLRLSASCRSALSRAASILSGLGVSPQAGVRGDEGLVGMIQFGGAISQTNTWPLGATLHDTVKCLGALVMAS